MKLGTLKFNKDVRLIGEPTIGNEKRLRFSKNKIYSVALNPLRMKTHFVDIHFIGKGMVLGVNPALFEFTPIKKRVGKAK
jgi:hypothetical protein